MRMVRYSEMFLRGYGTCMCICHAGKCNMSIGHDVRESFNRFLSHPYTRFIDARDTKLNQVDLYYYLVGGAWCICLT